MITQPRKSFIIGLFGTISLLFGSQAFGKPIELLFEEGFIVRTATKYEQKISEAPAIITVITAEDIQRKGYESIAETLRSAAGFYVIDDLVNPDLSIRGVSGGLKGQSRMLKVMIDGQPVSYRVSGSNFIGEELLPITAIERIEIIRGPGSALYGANAFLGVINIITKNKSKPEFSIKGKKIEKGTTAGAEVLVGKTFNSGDFLFAASGMNIDRSGFYLPENSPKYNVYKEIESNNDLSKPRVGYGIIRWGKEPWGKFILNGNYQYLDKYGEFQNWGVLTHENRISLTNGFIKGAYQKNLGNKLNLLYSFAFAKGGPNAKEHLDIESSLYWKRREVGYTSKEMVFESKYDFTVRNNLTVGVDYIRENQNLQTIYSVFKRDFGAYQEGNEVLDGAALGDKLFTNLGFYVQGVYYPLQKLSLTVGGRRDAHNIYGNVTNSRLGLSYQFTNEVYGKLLYGTSFMAPAPDQLFSNPLKSEDIVGNPDLAPERDRTLEILLGWNVPKKIDVSVNWFQNIIKDKIEFNQVGGFLRAQNLAKLASTGIEGEVKIHRKEMDVYVNSSYQNTTLVGEIDEDKKKVGICPNTTFNWGLNYSLPQYYLNFNWENNYIGRRKASQSNIVENRGRIYYLEDYNISSFTISTANLKLIREQETVFSFKIDNVFNTKYEVPEFKGIDIPGLGRKFIIKVTQRF